MFFVGWKFISFVLFLLYKAAVLVVLSRHCVEARVYEVLRLCFYDESKMARRCFVLSCGHIYDGFTTLLMIDGDVAVEPVLTAQVVHNRTLRTVLHFYGNNRKKKKERKKRRKKMMKMNRKKYKTRTTSIKDQ